MEEGEEFKWPEQLLDFFEKGPPRKDIEALLLSKDQDLALIIDLADVMQRRTGGDEDDGSALAVFGSDVLRRPVTALPVADNILRRACLAIMSRKPELGERDISKFKLRVHQLPAFPDFHRATVPQSEDTWQMICFSGTVIRCTLPKVLLKNRPSKCLKCQGRFMEEAEFDLFYRFEKHRWCPATPNCSGTTFKTEEVTDYMLTSLSTDYQEIKIQERFDNLAGGTIPRAIWGVLEDELVDKCKPGDDVEVTGIVRRRWHIPGKGYGGRTDIDLALQVSHVAVTNDRRAHVLSQEDTSEFEDYWRVHEQRPLAGRDKILESFCPQVYGLFALKLALAMTVCGGVERVDEDGGRVRGEAHMLVLGDPGTGKSQLIRYTAKLGAKSVITTGVGSTAAGLTASAVKEDGSWHLQAGALVMADGGIACIDEFSTMSAEDSVSMHEAMEQQRISIAKAGMVTKLEAKCTVLAAANPRGRFDHSKTMTENSGIGPALLSRFDLIFLLLDRADEEADGALADLILGGRATTKESEEEGNGTSWSFDKLRNYLAFCRTKKPLLDDDASLVLSRYYRARRGQVDGSDRPTVRLLQSGIRLAQGHAKLLCRSEVQLQDAIVAILVMEESAFGPALPRIKVMKEDDPDKEYKHAAGVVLGFLGLTRLIPRIDRGVRVPGGRSRNEPRPSLPPTGPPSPRRVADRADETHVGRGEKSKRPESEQVRVGEGIPDEFDTQELISFLSTDSVNFFDDFSSDI